LELTERLDLRGGHPCWEDPAADKLPSVALPERVDVAIVGAGIMGAMLAERLTRDGLEVALVDRRAPAQGSTAASTALILWAADVPLTQLSARIGADDAARMWRRVHRAVQTLDELVADQALDCRWRSRPELYLAGTLLDQAGLLEEADLRRAAGLRSTPLEAAALAERFGLPPRAALLSHDTFGVDPVALTLALLGAALRRGATLSAGHEVVGLDQRARSVILHCQNGSQVEADRVILATGYEAARWYLPPAFELHSSFAIATAPGTAPAWREKAMLWEASDPYLYARGTVDGRIVIGGEDEDLVDPSARDRLIAPKRAILEHKGAALLGLDRLQADCAWAATFGASPDGMPAIGKAANADNIWIAYGFGGNGISFASLAAELIAAEFAGTPDQDAALFDPYRF
jgi:glycine/D-amino acid oxidase-like deaminating enzyme